MVVVRIKWNNIHLLKQHLERSSSPYMSINCPYYYILPKIDQAVVEIGLKPMSLWFTIWHLFLLSCSL